MILKTSLHIHTKEDRKDGHMIDYDVYRLIDHAHRCGFKVLGFTPHQKFVFRPEFAEYALTKGILLIPGVERSLGRLSQNHVVILNCDKSIEKVRNFKQLIAYKEEHPEIFILSPHPTYSRIVSMGVRNLRKYIGLFDAVEHSWVHTFRNKRNKKAQRIADEFNKPMVATADLHVLKKLNTDYCLVETESFDTVSVLTALRNGNFQNIAFPKRHLDLFIYLLMTQIKYVYKFLEQRLIFAGFRKIFPVRVRYDE